MTIDPSSYPAIWETICAYASLSTTLALRATCTTLRDTIDASLLTHLCAKGPPHFPYEYDEDNSREPKKIRGAFERGFFLSPLEDGFARIRVPPATSARGSVIRRRCRVVDIDRTLSDGDCRWIARLTSPHTLRVVSPSPINEAVTLGRPNHPVWDGSGRACVIIAARRVVLGPTPALGYFPDQSRTEMAFIGKDRILFRLVVPMSDVTRRLVLHLYAFADRLFYPAIDPGRLRELVLVVHPASQQVENSRVSHGGVEGCMIWYLQKLAAKLPKVVITVVGLEAVCDTVPQGVLSLAADSGQRMELRTKEEHRAALSPGQWSLEMEL